MSHSRGIIEWYKLKEDSFQWVYGDSSLQWSEPAPPSGEDRLAPQKSAICDSAADSGAVYGRRL